MKALGLSDSPALGKGNLVTPKRNPGVGQHTESWVERVQLVLPIVSFWLGKYTGYAAGATVKYG